MTENKTLDFPGIEDELPTEVELFQLAKYSDEKGSVTVKYNVESAWLALKGYYDTESGEPKARSLERTPFRIYLDKERGDNACPRRYTDSFESGKAAVEALEQVAAWYQEGTLYEESDYHYFTAVRYLLEEYAADCRIQVSVNNWPSEFLESNVGLYDKDAGQLVADVDILHGEKTRAFLTIPPNYKSPMEEPPIAEIEDPNKLPEPGKLIYQIFDIVTFIGLSPAPENTNMRRVRGLLKKLHIEHDYHPDLTWQGLLETAQQRGHLVEDERHVTEESLPSDETDNPDTEEDTEPVENWF